MNKYRIRDTGQVVTEAEYRAMYPNISFPPVLRPADADAILQSPAPPVTEYQVAYQNGVKQDSLLNWVVDWDIRNFTPEEIAAHAANKAALAKVEVHRKIELLWMAADAYVASYISGMAIGLLTMGLMKNKPKCTAVSVWSAAIWTEYYARKAAITATSVLNTDFSSFGAIPFSVPALRIEVGL